MTAPDFGIYPRGVNHTGEGPAARLYAGEYVFTPESRERYLALIAIPDPPWYGPLVRLLAALPGTGALSTHLDEWRTARAVRRYRARSGA